MKELDDALKKIDEKHWPAKVMEGRQSLQESFGFIKNTVRASRDLGNSHSPGLELMQKAVQIDITTWIARSASMLFPEKLTHMTGLWSRLGSLVPGIKSAPGMSEPFTYLLKTEFRFVTQTLNVYGVSGHRASKRPKTASRPARPKTHR